MVLQMEFSCPRIFQSLAQLFGWIIRVTGERYLQVLMIFLEVAA